MICSKQTVNVLHTFMHILLRINASTKYFVIKLKCRYISKARIRLSLCEPLQFTDISI